ncbi:MAG: LemA protein [Saprospiraceae bacterium]|jgi:LemA protein
MKTTTIIWSVIGGLALIALYIGIFKAPGTYSTAVLHQEEVVESWGNVEVTYQRRADLIPNLVSTVKGYAAHEKDVLLGVTEARSKVGQVNIDASNLNAANIKKFQQAQSGLTQALSKLMVVMERYPDLKANQNFLQLQAQLEGTENRISVARQRYNGTVKTYNTFIRGYWKRTYIGWFAEEGEFEKKGVFKADKGAETAPTVTF